MSIVRIYLWLVITLVTSGCDKRGDEDGDLASGRVTAGGAAAGSIVGQLQVGEGVESSAVAKAKLTVVGQPTVLATSKSDGSFRIDGAAPGNLEILALSATDGGKLALTQVATSAATYGVKIDDVILPAGATIDVGLHEMKKTGTLTGIVDFYDNPNELDRTGSDVFIPGTTFIAKTDSNGAFTIAGLPEGYYTLRAQHTGFAVVELIRVQIVSDATTDLGTILLSLSKGPQGNISVSADHTATIAGEAASIFLSRTVTARLRYDSNAALMKVSDEPSFLNTEWQPVAPTFDWTFTSDGIKSLYVTYADLNGLESSPYAVSFYVDTEAPTISSFTLLNGWDQVSSTATKMSFDVAAIDTGTGVKEMLIANSSAFAGNSGWIPYSSTYHDWNSPASDTWIKVRDFAGRESVAATDHINIGTHTVVRTGTIAGDVTLRKAQSPFVIGSSMTIEGDFTVEPGVHIKIDVDQSGLKVLIRGLATMVGTSVDPILVKGHPSRGFFGFDSSQSQLDDHRFEYVHSIDGDDLRELFVINGGVVRNCYVSHSGTSNAFSTLVVKGGHKSAVIERNTILPGTVTANGPAIKILSGSNATRIEHNEFRVLNVPIQLSDSDGTVIRYNTLQSTRTEMSGIGSAYAVTMTNASAQIYRNQIENGGSDMTMYSWVFSIAGSGAQSTVVYENNISVLPTGSNGAHVRCLNAVNQITFDDNFYSGCAGLCQDTPNDNPTSITSGCTNFNISPSLGSAWDISDSKTSGCVGHACTD